MPPTMTIYVVCYSEELYPTAQRAFDTASAANKYVTEMFDNISVENKNAEMLTCDGLIRYIWFTEYDERREIYIEKMTLEFSKK